MAVSAVIVYWEISLPVIAVLLVGYELGVVFGWIPSRGRRRAPEMSGPEGPNGILFRERVAGTLAGLGYTSVHLLGPPGDGVDIVAADPMGRKTAVRCEHQSGSIRPVEIRGLIGSAHLIGADRAILVTTGTFSTEALSQAARGGVECWDGRTFDGQTGRARRAA